MKILLLFLFVFKVYASVEIEVNPRKPVVNETFQILFRIETESETEPEISFDPKGLEILGKDTQGVSTRTIYVNGQLSITREIVIVYEAIATQKGPGYLKNINLIIDGKRQIKSDVTIVVVDQPQEVSSVFISAEAAPKNVYVGQGINVRYYVYDKNNLRAFDIKKYPKLDQFLKRFIQENEQPQRVAVDNQIFKRQIIYSSKLFVEKPGKWVIDPMEIAVSYSSDMYNPFGFGFGRSDLKTKTLQSEPVEIVAKELPKPTPEDFTGLVGEFTFTLKAESTNLLVNEPLEWKLTVVGDGALENFETPDLVPFKELEKFNDNSELKIMSPELAQKDIQYTYLAKSPGLIPARKMTLTTFSPKQGKYITHELNIPQIKIGGSGEVVKPKDEKTPEKKSEIDSSKDSKLLSISIPSDLNLNISILYEPVLWLGSLLLLTLFSFLMRYRPHQNILMGLNDILKLVGNKKEDYFSLQKLLHHHLPFKDLSVRQRIQKSYLSKSAKDELVSVLDNLEKKSFSLEQKPEKIIISTKTRKELLNLDKKEVKYAEDEFTF